MIRLIAAFKSGFFLALRRPKEAIIALLVLLLALQGWRLRREQGRTQELAAKLEGLPPGVKQVVTVYRDRVVTKWKEGQTRVIYRNRYLPPEGHVEVTVKEDQPELPSDVVIKDHGFTRRLGGGFVYSDRLLPELDLKWAYWRRYSLTVGLTPAYGGLGISRHVDDFTPFGNLELFGLTGLDWHGTPHLGIGIRTNF